jgi:glycosyltransferase involved in cell wall biosynthesis
VPDNTSVRGAAVHGETGLIYREADIDSAVRQIYHLLDVPSFSRRLGQCARERIGRDYHLEATHAALLDAIEIPDPAWPTGSERYG